MVRQLLIDLSAEGFGPLRWVLGNPDEDGCNSARHGWIWLGRLRQAMARTADGSTEGSPSLLFSREQVWQGTLRLG